ncbi:MAG: LytR C-terminal domain-containing protein [Gemmatimonadetes bacterium]|nr:LytR C-terminal domain-containing protein [Gemmatimonadota bacterium]
MRKPGRWILLVVVIVGVVWYWRGRASGGGRPRRNEIAVQTIERVVPTGTRIRVEVLNGAGTRGLARRGTTAMRDAGFDVVGTGNWDATVDSSLVLVRTGNMDWGALAAKALGGARIEARPDTSRYVDLTIVLGTRWRAPALPFDP